MAAEAGKLYIVSTPIGNMEDISLRALEIIKTVDVLYAEDTRVTGKILKRYEVSTNMRSYRSALSSERKQAVYGEVVQLLREGKSMAYVSDAGTPGISDPVSELAAAVHEAGYFVVPIPGASSLTALISACGFFTQRPLFAGFLPKKKGHQTLLRKYKEALMSEVCDSIVFFESPHRIGKFLEELLEWELDIKVCVGRELTKLHEELIRGSLPEVLTEIKSRTTIKGEIVVIITL